MSERKAWTPEEDCALKELYEKRGVKKWAEISRLLEAEYGIPHRNGKQCRQRYHNHLDCSIRRDKWTLPEENLLLELQSQLGNHWADIARQLNGRSENTVKNQFYCILRRGVRKINLAVRQKLRRFREIDIAIVYKIVEDCQRKAEDKPTSLDLKKELIFFGMNELDPASIEVPHLKHLLLRFKSLDKGRHKKRDSRKHRLDEKDQSDPIQSDQYRDNFPEELPPAKQNSLFSFSFEKEEEKPPRQEEKPKQEEGRLSAMAHSHAQVKKSLSLQSLESLASRLEHAPSKIYDIFGTEVNLQNIGELSRLSAEGTPLCDSPYFDQIRSTFSSWGHHEQ